MNRSLFKARINHRWQRFLHSDVRQSVTKKILSTVATIAVAFFLAIIIACTVCKTWDKFGDVISAIFTSGFTSAFKNSLYSNAAIFVVGGLAFVFAYKAGLFNIGISGQMVAAGTVGTIISHCCGLGHGTNQFVVLITCMATGACVAGIVGAMKAYLHINEVVSSIMFNWIIYFMSILLLSYMCTNNWIPNISNLTTAAPDDSLLFRMGNNSYIPLLIMGGSLVILVAVIINFTVFGRKQRVTGLSNTGALAAGYNIKANMIAAMAVSGAISGILGAMLYCGYAPNMPITAAAKAIPQEGFNGISVGLISMCSPIASVPVSLFFAMVRTAVGDLQALGIDNHIADVVYGIVVYGAAAIALFLNLKPYWLTVKIFKGKKYSKIQHERNMTNIELLGLSSDQCSVLRKYYTFYKKNLKVKSSIKLSPIIKLKMKMAGVKYWFVTQRAKVRVWLNQRRDLMTYDHYYKQEMAHIIRRKHKLIVDVDHKKCGGWYIKLTDSLLNSKELRTVLSATTHCSITADLIDKLKEVNNNFKKTPFSNREIRLVPTLAYLQNLRSGLHYRNAISKQNKLTYFTFIQTKQQQEALGLGEIRTKTQFNFAHSAYFRAYDRTQAVVRNHYNSIVKAMRKSEQVNISNIRFDSARLADLYNKYLIEEIGKLSYLINCPLNDQQSKEVNQLAAEVRKLEKDLDKNAKEAQSYRNEAKRCAQEPKKALESKKYINKSKICNNNIITIRNNISKDKEKIASIVASARSEENIMQREKWLARKLANEKAAKKLAKIEARKARRGI
ncbi:MAG: ABC transporter permease subunit [Mycoplasmoidaceae bacterium]